MQNFDLTDGIELEHDLNDAYFEKLSRLGQPISFEVNQSIFHQGEAASWVYVLLSGSVKAIRSDENGHETLLKIHQVGSLIGLSALRPKAIRDATCIATQTVRAVEFSRNRFFDLMREDGELGVLLVQLLLKRQQLLHTRVSDVTGLSVEQRLARVLVQMHVEMSAYRNAQDQAELRISHEELAALVFSRRQYITAILRTFSKMGLIENKRLRLRILNAEALADIVSG
jgi:CRP-like cAMP-binding protein